MSLKYYSYENDPFAKTGSGQASGKVEEKAFYAGRMEAGLSFINAEHGNRLFDPAATNLTLHVMPLLEDYLKTHIFLRRDLWPKFDGRGVALGLEGIEVLTNFRALLELP